MAYKILYQRLLRSLFLFLFCIIPQAKAGYSFTDILCFEIDIINNKTLEDNRGCRNTRFRLPGVKLIQREKQCSFNKIQSHTKISILPVELFTICLGIYCIPKIYRFIKK